MLINREEKAVTFDITYCGPAGSGKSANLDYVMEALDSPSAGQARQPDELGEMLPISMGTVGGWKVSRRLWTTRGQKQYQQTRESLIAQSDGIIFVADSTPSSLSENVFSFHSMTIALSVADRAAEDLPVVLLYNKRDIADPIALEDLEESLNQQGLPFWETVATVGLGVMPPITHIVKTLTSRLNADQYDAVAAEKRIEEYWNAKKYSSALEELLVYLKYCESHGLTGAFNYILFLRTLYEAYDQLDDVPGAINALRRAVAHFQRCVNPRLLKPFAREYYFGAWAQLGYVLSVVGQKDESLAIFQKNLMLNLACIGPDSREYETVRWYIASLQKHGQIQISEMKPYLNDYDLWQEQRSLITEKVEGEEPCTYCLAGPRHVRSMFAGGRGTQICSDCIESCTEFAFLANQFDGDADFKDHLSVICGDARCWLCGRTSESTNMVVPTPRANACVECLEIARP